MYVLELFNFDTKIWERTPSCMCISTMAAFFGNCRDNCELDALLRQVQQLLSKGHPISEVVVHAPEDAVERFRMRAKAFLKEWPEIIDSRKLRCGYEMPNTQEEYGVE